MRGENGRCGQKHMWDAGWGRRTRQGQILAPVTKVGSRGFILSTAERGSIVWSGAGARPPPVPQFPCLGSADTGEQLSGRAEAAWEVCGLVPGTGEASGGWPLGRWGWQEPARSAGAHLFTADITLAAENWPGWEYLRQGHWRGQPGDWLVLLGWLLRGFEHTGGTIRSVFLT